MPLGNLLHERFLRLLNEGGAELDWAALGGLAMQDAGRRLEPQDSSRKPLRLE